MSDGDATQGSVAGPEPGSDEDPTAWAEVRRDLAASVRAFVDSFRSRELARAQTGYLAFSLTEWGGFIALVVYAFRDGGMGMVGLVALLQQIPAAVVASFGSALGDRYDRRRVLVLVFLALTSVTLAAGVAMVANAPAPIVYVLAAASGWVLTLVRPTYSALLPWIVRSPRELTTSYAANGLITSVSIFLGPMLVGGVLTFAESGPVSGPGLAFLTLGGILLVGTFLVWTMRTTNRLEGEEPVEGFGLGELGAGFRYAFGDRRCRLLVGLIGSSTFLLGTIDTLIVVLAVDLLGTGDAGVGFLNAALGVGAMVGASVAMVAGQRPRLFPSFRAGLLSSGTPLVVIAAAPALGAPMLAVAGGGMTLLDVTGVTMLQRIVPDDKLSRTYGVLETLYMATEGVGAFLAAAAVGWVGPRWTLLVSGALLPVAGFLVRRRMASLDVGVRVPSHEMGVLRGTDLFAPLPPTALERLSRNLVPIHVSAGDVVIREGDRGDRFYVIERGRVLVSSRSTPVTELGPGSYFGEVALLYDQPRNATVTAETDLTLFVLERDEFLRTVTGHDAVGALARRTADARSNVDPADP
ncbi:MAG TPA: MFS transporter [Actinomycetota bacterium]|nr:MFS transporter [Actinomycetota bacterium]